MPGGRGEEPRLHLALAASSWLTPQECAPPTSLSCPSCLERKPAQIWLRSPAEASGCWGLGAGAGLLPLPGAGRTCRPRCDGFRYRWALAMPGLPPPLPMLKGHTDILPHSPSSVPGSAHRVPGAQPPAPLGPAAQTEGEAPRAEPGRVGTVSGPSLQTGLPHPMVTAEPEGQAGLPR